MGVGVSGFFGDKGLCRLYRGLSSTPFYKFVYAFDPFGQGYGFDDEKQQETNSCSNEDAHDDYKGHLTLRTGRVERKNCSGKTAE
jgi:hypothetical protein